MKGLTQLPKGLEMPQHSNDTSNGLCFLYGMLISMLSFLIGFWFSSTKSSELHSWLRAILQMMVASGVGYYFLVKRNDLNIGRDEKNRTDLSKSIRFFVKDKLTPLKTYLDNLILVSISFKSLSEVGDNLDEGDRKKLKENCLGVKTQLEILWRTKMLSLMIEKSLDTFDFDLVEKLVTLERAVSKWEKKENTLSIIGD